MNLISQAREWLEDCEFPNLSRAEIWGMDEDTVQSAMNAYWDGGWAAFSTHNEVTA